MLKRKTLQQGVALVKKGGMSSDFSMLIVVVNYRERYTYITVECGLREGERGLCPYCCGIVSSWILTVKDI